MKDVIIKCEKGEVKKTLAFIERKRSSVRWASGDKPTGYGGMFEENGVYLVIECDVLTFIKTDEFEDSDKKDKTVVSADEFLRKSKNPSIVIFRRDRNVIAKNVATGDEGIAKCSPDDEFVFKTGASIALARLMAKTPEVLNHDVKDEWIKVLGLTPVEKKVYTDEDRNFKVGDRVVVRDWDDMEKEYGKDSWGIIKDSRFVERMKHLCGRTATVTCVVDGFRCKKVEVDFDDKSGSINWTFNPWMFNPTDVPASEKEKPEAMLDKWDESKIHEGDTVKVINTGLNYSSYVQWVGEHISDPYMAARFCFGSPSMDEKYKVIKIAEHERNHRPLAYIEEIDGISYNKCYLIEVKGLEKV